MVKYFKDKPADYRIKERLEEFEPSQRNTMTALDLGCGGGRHTELLVQLGFITHILDPNPQMLKCTTQRVGAHLLKSVKRGSIVKLPFADKVFDIVVTTGVLHQAKNLCEYEQAIRELARVMKPSGVLCLNIFTAKVIDESMSALKSSFVYETKEGLIMTLLSRECFYKLMEWSGFSLEKEISEDIVSENTGPRAVLRCNFIKK